MNSDVSAKAKCLKQNSLFWSSHSEEPLTLRGLSTYVGAVVTFEESFIAAEGLVCCCSSSVLTGSRKNAVKTQMHWSKYTVCWPAVPGDTYFWFCSISNRADKADVPFLPCGGGTGSVGYGGIGLVTCRPFIGVPFCCVQSEKKGKEMAILASKERIDTKVNSNGDVFETAISSCLRKIPQESNLTAL